MFSTSRHQRHDTAHHGKFTPLPMSEMGTNSPRGGAGLSSAAKDMVTATKLISPYITLKTFLVIIFISLLIIAVAILAAVLIITSEYTMFPVPDMTSEASEPSFVNASERTESPLSSTTTPFILSSSSSSTTSRTTASTKLTTTTVTTSTPSTTSSSTAPTTTTTTYRPPCKSGEYQCANYQCVDHSKLCDGYPDCEDGTDESLFCNCTTEQFRCSNGQCIPKSSVCDKFFDCLTYEDEANCPDCAGFRCKSNNVCLWDSNEKRCDAVFDCDDFSDEINCNLGYGHSRCKNGVEVRSLLWCDGVDDCGDNTDEENCVCEKLQKFACTSKPQGQCIPRQWVCDGISDCETGADESSCTNCSADQFQCKDYSCIPHSMHCDGKVDCATVGGDEDNCVKVDTDNELTITFGGVMLPVCWDFWSNDHSAYVCSSQQRRLVSSWPTKKLSPASRFAVLKNQSWNIADPTNQTFSFSEACPSGEIVNIKCQDQGLCGLRKVEFLESYVAGGGLPPLGKWPWVVSLSFLDTLICGGALIARRWVLTAAHCLSMPVPDRIDLDFTKTSFYFTITAGSILKINDPKTKLSANDLYRQTVRVAEIINHPYEWDLALLKLEKEVTYTEAVQPLCLPPEDYVFLPRAYCYLAGWGHFNSKQYMRPQTLRDARLQVWTENRCSKNKVLGETIVNINSTICTGYRSGVPSGCTGDSGGPLMCLDPASGLYTLAGIMSRGASVCGQGRSLSNRFARVSTSVQWIKNIMGKRSP
uniref:Peptidase S1 domain-containing protein n=1 Tax=Biomphalaria glabrata TaxID=6526 RepID=A0A2C9JX34_BIOGL